MQALSVFISNPVYTSGMAAGRPSKSERSPFGERLLAARQQVGFSQTQLAEKLGITQQTYAGWERRTTALRPEHLAQLAVVLNVPVDHLLGRERSTKRGPGPIGKARRMFEEVNKLPRDRQQHVLRVVEDLLKANRLESKAA
jgi:transcriptional regulator with XRE-family HTH domain